MNGEALRGFRLDVLGWSQARLAEALDVDRGTIGRWERGVLEVQHPHILMLALAYLSLQDAMDSLPGVEPVGLPRGG